MDVERRLQLATEYARYSQSYNGLGKTLGGVAGLIVLLAGTFIGGGTVTAVLTLCLTLLWLAGKELLRARVYQPMGVAQEIWEREQKRLHLFLTCFTGLISIGAFAVFISDGRITEPDWWPYLFFVALLPFVTWRFLRTPLEFVVGVGLLAACAVHSTGGAYALSQVFTWSWFVGALALIPLGISEHRRFLALSQQLQEGRS